MLSPCSGYQRPRAQEDFGGDCRGVVAPCHRGSAKRPATSELARILIALAAQRVLVEKGVHILGEARPNLRHLQHDGLGLLAVRSARDLETPRGKLPILPGAPHPLFLPTPASIIATQKGPERSSRRPRSAACACTQKSGGRSSFVLDLFVPFGYADSNNDLAGTGGSHGPVWRSRPRRGVFGLCRGNVHMGRGGAAERGRSVRFLCSVAVLVALLLRRCGGAGRRPQRFTAVRSAALFIRRAWPLAAIRQGLPGILP